MAQAESRLHIGGVEHFLDRHDVNFSRATIAQRSVWISEGARGKAAVDSFLWRRTDCCVLRATIGLDDTVTGGSTSGVNTQYPHCGLP